MFFRLLFICFYGSLWFTLVMFSGRKNHIPEDGSDPGKSRGPSGISLTLHTSGFLHTSSPFCFFLFARRQRWWSGWRWAVSFFYWALSFNEKVIRQQKYLTGCKEIYPGSLNQECWLPVYHCQAGPSKRTQMQIGERSKQTFFRTPCPRQNKWSKT